MAKSRPINLNLFTIHFPIPAIVSILHRLSGAILFLFIPFFLWGLSYSLTTDGFYELQIWRENAFIKILLWLLISSFLFHWIAGIKHLLLDLHIGASLQGTRLGSYLTFVIFFILAFLVGIWLW